MADERLSFEEGQPNYHAYYAAQHVVRYAMVKDFVAGKRVLDVACGEGYGCALMRSWGAASVVGVDVSSDAIAAAKKQFSDEQTQFVEGNVEELSSILDTEDEFDIIVSFETIEHVSQPKSFLAEISKVSRGSAIIIISCPNDPIHQLNNPKTNEFHLAIYQFSKFKEVTKSVLGKAHSWLLEAPIVCLLYTSPSPRDLSTSRMPSSA